MLGAAEPTPYDLRFRLFNIPVRVHPLFWLVMAILASGNSDLRLICLFIGCAFVSILVHEFGHGLMATFFGFRAHEIVLYGMGGYCQCEIERQSPKERLAVLFMGPGAGFLLLAAMFLLARVLLGISFIDDVNLVRMVLGLEQNRIFSVAFGELPQLTKLTYLTMIQINLMWGLLNLLPIWPLDGGRITEVLLNLVDRRKGTRWAHVVSLLTAGILAVIFFRFQETFMGIWFLYFGFVNYQILQSITQSSRYYSQEDDADWWKR
ncbi:site-2 protease family protein [Singulisphaera sp. PoT]|uniref:site-2 protease family protein n=1 Tax=Singulisphaera sp. PoT TaxID=3411797 RepID=UPI003BF55CB2